MEAGDENYMKPRDLQRIKDNIQQNFAQASIYYQTLNVRKIEQTPKYSVRC